jgi:hypothetical protein
VLEASCRLLPARAGPRGEPRPVVELRLRLWVVLELSRSLERALRLGIGGERGRSLGSADEHVASLLPNLGRVVGIPIGRQGVEVVRGDDLHKLVLLPSDCQQEASRLEVLRLALTK